MKEVRRPIWLRKDGKHIVVLVELNGEWREVIRELPGDEFSHIWEDNPMDRVHNG